MHHLHVKFLCVKVNDCIFQFFLQSHSALNLISMRLKLCRIPMNVGLFASQKTGLHGAEVEIAGGVFFRPPQCDKRVFGWSGKGVGMGREVLLPLPPRP